MVLIDGEVDWKVRRIETKGQDTDQNNNCYDFVNGKIFFTFIRTLKRNNYDMATMSN